jgi:type VII secretion protein EccB
MWTQRDQLQAYQFLRRRLVSALQTGDANHPVSPSRRVVVSAAAGVACAVLITAGFAVYGVVRPGANQDWRKPGQVVVERETGADFVLGADGLLHPVLNYTSARLLAGGDGSATVTVSGRSLVGVPRGAPLGIAGAPASPPARERLVGGPWTVCSSRPDNRPSGGLARTTAIVGVTPTGAVVAARDALIVRDQAGASYAIVEGRRLRIRDAATAAALGYDGTVVLAVSSAWLGAVPVGPDLALISITGHGRTGPRVGTLSTVVGQVLVVDTVSGDSRYYVVQMTGMDPVTQTEAALILGNPANRDAYPTGTPHAIAVSAADLAGKPQADNPSADYPAYLPHPVAARDNQVACATSDGSQRVSVRLTDSIPLPPGGRSMQMHGAPGDGRIADEVFVPPGRGALVRDQSSPGIDTGTVYVLTEQAVRFPIGGSDAIKALGYGAARPVPVASTLLALFPTGPALDMASAERVMTP